MTPRNREEDLADLIRASIDERVYAASPPANLAASVVRGARRRRMTQASLAGAASLTAAGLLVPVLLTGQWGLGGAGGSHAPLGSDPVVTLTVTQTITTPPSLTPTTAPTTPTTTTSAPTTSAPPTATAAPTLTDQERVTRFIALAKDPLPGLVSRLGFASTVDLWVGQAVAAELPWKDLASRDAWILGDQRTEYAQRSGPFDMLALLRSTPTSETTWGVGHHPGCSVPALPENVVPGARRVWIQPKDGTIDSCIDWWSVDMWINQNGDVAAVTFEMGAP